MSKTRVLEPLKDVEKENIPNVAKHFQRICSYLNDLKAGEEMNFPDFLRALDMTEKMYLRAIRSSLKAPKLFLERKVSEIRVNSYNYFILRCWEANIDVQFILDAYACAAYVVSYISKSQRDMSNLMYETCKEARQGNKGLQQQVRHIGNKFLSHVEVCAQEAVYLLLQLSMRSCTRSFVFINTSPCETRTFLLKSHDILSEMPENSTDIQSDNALLRFQRRPRLMKNCCLADFVSQYEFVYPKKTISQGTENEFLPEDEQIEEDEDVINLDECVNENQAFEEEIPMGNGILKKGKSLKSFAMLDTIENSFREQLMLFFPWKKEKEDLLGNSESYEVQYNKKLSVITANKKEYEMDDGLADLIENNSDELCSDSHVVAPEVQHIEKIDKNEQSEKQTISHGCFDPKDTGHTYDLGLDLGISRKQINGEPLVNSINLDNYLSLTRNLNERQKMVFYHVLNKIKAGDLPFYCFLTGGAGVGKSIVTTALYQAITRFYAKSVTHSPDEIKAVLCAPTGKAAHNIGGHTIHSLFCIPANQSLKFKPLAVQQLDIFQVKFRSLKVLLLTKYPWLVTKCLISLT